MTSSGPADLEGSTPRVAGVVLAAGEGRRMGSPKPLLELEGESFVSRCVRTLGAGGCDPVLVVRAAAAPEAAEVARAAEAAGALVIDNTPPAGEQIDSLRTALRSIPGEADAVVVVPVDAPAFRADTVAALLDRYAADAPAVVVPLFRGRRGHPTLFARSLFPELMEGSLPQGARSVIAAHEAEVAEVPVEDPGVSLDVDTTADLRDLRG